MINLTLENGKTIMVGVTSLQAAITGATGSGALIVLGGGITYDVRESPAEIAALLDEYKAKNK
ncbi:hypothetical protein [Neptunicoccus sediminis]|uniref:hypothetical protein n=1 Tax=Neptunicoccus sediminis TaxID=1892596 RepID=UPI000845F91E|nr:hypothetical protein [Neptunicoccus sediminis]